MAYNTGNPIGSADPRDLYDNAQNLDVAVNTEADSWTDRLGRTRKTFQGQINDLLVAGGRIFPDEATGREEVEDGDYYLAESIDPDVSKTIWRRIDASNSEKIADEPAIDPERLGRVLSTLLTGDSNELIYELLTPDGLVLSDFYESTGTFRFPSVEAGRSYKLTDGPEVTSGSDDTVWEVETDIGELIASISSNGELDVSALSVGGNQVTGTGVSFLPTEYIMPYVSQDTIDFINAQPVTQGDGTDYPMSSTVEPPVLSIDVSTYGFRYAHLSSEITWTGNRLWMAAFGQNVRPGSNGEGADAFTFLRYCDNPFDSAPIWREVLYVVPRTAGVEDNEAYEPVVSTLPDGRLLVQTATGNAGNPTFGFIIDNPEATTGCFNVGRIHYLGLGVPTQIRVIGGRILAMFDRRPGEIDTTLRELTPVGMDYLQGTDITTLPPIEASVQGSVVESFFVGVGGGRLMVVRRSTDGAYTSVSDAGAETWTNPLVPWTEYPTTDTLTTQDRSPSGRIVRVWNNSTTERDFLTVGLSEDDGASFPWTLMIQEKTPIEGTSLTQYPQYPSVAFDVIAGEVFVVVSYDHGRRAAENGHTRIAFVSEQKIRDQTATLDDVRYIIAAQATNS